MNEKRHIKQQVQDIVENIFDTGEEGDKVHTLKLVHSLSSDSAEKLTTAISAAPGVKKVHVDTQNKRVQVLCTGEIEPLIDAAQAAGFRVNPGF